MSEFVNKTTDTDQLKARSVELAERVYRQKDQAKGLDERKIFDDTGDELIRIKNPNRFYFAQSMLESVALWTNLLRSLAHEINVADQKIRDTNPMSLDAATAFLRKWAARYQESSAAEVEETGRQIQDALGRLEAKKTPQDIKGALNYLLSFAESVLAHVHSGHDPRTETVNDTVLQTRAIRDALLTARDIMIDARELIAADTGEIMRDENVQLARESLNEIYAHMESSLDR